MANVSYSNIITTEEIINVIVLLFLPFNSSDKA